MDIHVDKTGYSAVPGFTGPDTKTQEPDQTDAPVSDPRRNPDAGRDKICFTAESLESDAADYEAQDSGFRITVSCSSYSTAGGYARLAGAFTKGQVQTVLGETHRNIASLRMAASLGDSRQREKAQASIASLQSLIRRGKRKMKKLDEENRLKIRKKRAERHRKP